jgi:RNA polymerase sigma-70 factor (ECF subfamily)
MNSDPIKSIENLFTQKRDLILIKESLAGNSRSFAKLLSFYKQKVTSLGMSFFRNHADREDFEQEVFIKVFKNLESFRGDCKFSTWLLKIAYTTAINSKERKKEYESISNETLIPAETITPEEESLQSFTKQVIREAVKELPQKYEVCLDMFFFYDLSLDEISVITSYPVNTIKSHIFRAKKLLAEKLIEYKTKN